MDWSHVYYYNYENPLTIPAGSTPDKFHNYATYGSQTSRWNLVPTTKTQLNGTNQVTCYPSSQMLAPPSAANDQDTESGTANQVPIMDWPAITLMPDDKSTDPTGAPPGEIGLMAGLSVTVDASGNRWVMISLAESSTSCSFFNPANGQPILWGNTGSDGYPEYCQNAAEDKHGYYTQQVIVEISPDNTQLALGGHSPSTTTVNVTDSTSQSVTIQLLTAVAGGAVNKQSSQSVTLPDFTAADESTVTPPVVKTVYSNAQFPQPTDVVGGPPEFNLKDLPLSAMTNLSLPTQGQWSAGANFTSIVTFTISITATVAYIEKGWDLVTADTYSEFATAQRLFTIPVNFAYIVPPPPPPKA